VTSIESVAFSMQILIDYYPSVYHLSDIALKSLNYLADRITQIENRAASHLLALALFSMITFCDLSLLSDLLSIIENIVTQTPLASQVVMCKFLNVTILKNFDLTRKNMCVDWYLKLLKKLNLNSKISIVTTDPTLLSLPQSIDVPTSKL
jgi:hypothetical protein